MKTIIRALQSLFAEKEVANPHADYDYYDRFTALAQYPREW